jgi:RNA polymerase sigma factor (TIGR02999 family)
MQRQYRVAGADVESLSHIRVHAAGRPIRPSRACRCAAAGGRGESVTRFARGRFHGHQGKRGGPGEGRDAEVFPELYNELRRLARSRLASGGRNVLLDTTALVHESFLRLHGAGRVGIADRDHFLAYAATTMRTVVIDFLRRKGSEKRGGDVEHITLDTALGEVLGAKDDEILDVHEALQSLAKVDERLVKVVEMRYFAGLTDEEIGRALDISERTVRRDWERARLLLAEMLRR